MHNIFYLREVMRGQVSAMLSKVPRKLPCRVTGILWSCWVLAFKD